MRDVEGQALMDPSAERAVAAEHNPRAKSHEEVGLIPSSDLSREHADSQVVGTAARHAETADAAASAALGPNIATSPNLPGERIDTAQRERDRKSRGELAEALDAIESALEVGAGKDFGEDPGTPTSAKVDKDKASGIARRGSKEWGTPMSSPEKRSLSITSGISPSLEGAHQLLAGLEAEAEALLRRAALPRASGGIVASPQKGEAMWTELERLAYGKQENDSGDAHGIELNAAMASGHVGGMASGHVGEMASGHMGGAEIDEAGAQPGDGNDDDDDDDDDDSGGGDTYKGYAAVGRDCGRRMRAGGCELDPPPDDDRVDGGEQGVRDQQSGLGGKEEREKVGEREEKEDREGKVVVVVEKMMMVNHSANHRKGTGSLDEHALAPPYEVGEEASLNQDAVVASPDCRLPKTSETPRAASHRTAGGGPSPVAAAEPSPGGGGGMTSDTCSSLSDFTEVDRLPPPTPQPGVLSVDRFTTPKKVERGGTFGGGARAKGAGASPGGATVGTPYRGIGGDSDIGDSPMVHSGIGRGQGRFLCEDGEEEAGKGKGKELDERQLFVTGLCEEWVREKDADVTERRLFDRVRNWTARQRKTALEWALITAGAAARIQAAWRGYAERRTLSRSWAKGRVGNGQAGGGRGGGGVGTPLVRGVKRIEAELCWIRSQLASMSMPAARLDLAVPGPSPSRSRAAGEGDGWDKVEKDLEALKCMWLGGDEGGAVGGWKVSEVKEALGSVVGGVGSGGRYDEFGVGTAREVNRILESEGMPSHEVSDGQILGLTRRVASSTRRRMMCTLAAWSVEADERRRVRLAVWWGGWEGQGSLTPPPRGVTLVRVRLWAVVRRIMSRWEAWARRRADRREALGGASAAAGPWGVSGSSPGGRVQGSWADAAVVKAREQARLLK